MPHSSASATASSPYLSRSAPAAHSPPRGFWNTAYEETLETRQREDSLRQRQADFERQRDLARRTLEQVQREKAAAQAAREKAAIDAQLAAARQADEERQRRKQAARVAAEQAAAEHRRALAEIERQKGEERRQREADRLRREQSQRKRTWDAWERYDERWASLGEKGTDLTFADIPWPTSIQPRSPSDISSFAIKNFVLSPLHSTDKSTRQRLREQLLRYHPDRFEGRWLTRVRESDRDAVKLATNNVARYLNEALSQPHLPYASTPNSQHNDTNPPQL